MLSNDAKIDSLLVFSSSQFLPNKESDGRNTNKKFNFQHYKFHLLLFLVVRKII